MGGWEAFSKGVQISRRYPQTLAAAFLFSLLPALALAVLPALTLLEPAHRPAIRDAADGIDAWLLMDMALSPASLDTQLRGSEQTLPQSTQGAVLTGMVTLFLLPFAAWLPGAFFYGGALLMYANTPQPFHWRRFVWGGWHWLGCFAALALLQALAWLVLFVPVFLSGLGVVSGGGWQLYLSLAAIAVVGTFLLAWGETSRAAAIVNDTRNPIRALGLGGRLLFSRPLALLGLYLPALVLLLALHAIFRLGLLPLLPLSAWPLVLLVQQTFILARLWVRLARLAGNVTLFDLPASQPA